MEPFSHQISLRTDSSQSADFSQRVTYTYLIGVYLATNAIRDAYTLVDGPDCCHMKTQFIQGNHDWLANLVSVSGHHRIGNTALHPVQMAKGREDALRSTLMRMAEHPFTGGVLLTSMPMAAVTAVDYERICREVSRKTQRPVITVPGRSLTGDWMDGYEEVLVALARRLDLSEGRPDPSRAAIIGYLMDRNEGDHRANIKELRRLLEAIGLEVVSIWLEGQAFSELSKVKDAGLVISFPYGRKAARWLVQRTEAKLLECDYPFGLSATERFLRQVAREIGQEAKAEALIEEELSAVIPSCEFIIPFIFQHRKAGYIGDPVLVRGLYDILTLFGAELDFAVITNPKHRLLDLDSETLGGAELLVFPKLRAMMELLSRKANEPRLALLVTNNAGYGLLRKPGLGVVEFGFPSFFYHCLAEQPFLGFRGFLSFVDRLANAMRAAEAEAWADALL